MKHIPNILTLMNLLCGSLAVVFALEGYLAIASYFIILGWLFDFLDGFAARLLHVQSLLGRELDSLADVITFGLAPAAILFALQLKIGGHGSFTIEQPFIDLLVGFLPFLLPVFAGLRLAKFNIDEGQANRFIGLPTPANGIMVLSLPLVMHSQSGSFLILWLSSGYFIPIYAIVVSYLMVSPLRLYSLKVKGFSWKANKYTYTLLAIAALLVGILGTTGLFLVIPAYIIYASALDWYISRNEP